MTLCGEYGLHHQKSEPSFAHICSCFAFRVLSLGPGWLGGFPGAGSPSTLPRLNLKVKALAPMLCSLSELVLSVFACSPHVKLNQQFTFDQQRIVSPLLYPCSKLARDVLHILWGVRGGAVYQVEVPSFSSRTKLINRDALVFIRKCPGLDMTGLLRLLPPPPFT